MGLDNCLLVFDRFGNVNLVFLKLSHVVVSLVRLKGVEEPKENVGCVQDNVSFGLLLLGEDMIQGGELVQLVCKIDLVPLQFCVYNGVSDEVRSFILPGHWDWFWFLHVVEQSVCVLYKIYDVGR